MLGCHCCHRFVINACRLTNYRSKLVIQDVPQLLNNALVVTKGNKLARRMVFDFHPALAMGNKSK